MLPCSMSSAFRRRSLRARGTRAWWTIVVVAALSLVTGTPGDARGQAGWYVTPSLTASQDYDDNVFSRPARESDFISRLSPNLKAGYQSKPFTLLLGAGVDAEYFADHPNLSGVNRKHASLDVAYVPELTGPTTTLALQGLFAETETPSELQPLTGIEVARQTTRLWSAGPSITYQLSPATSGEAGYAYRELESRTSTSVAQQAQLGIASQLTRLDSGRLRYSLGVTDSAGATTTSHALTAGWTTKLSHAMTLALDAGPRLSDGRVEPDVTARLSERFKLGEVSLTYQRTETVVIAQPGAVETNSVLGALTLSPTRRLQIDLGSGYSVTATPGGDVSVYRASAAISYRLTKWLGLSAAYRFLRQDQGVTHVDHNI